MQRALQLNNKVKLHFLIKKKVNYGLAVYVVGSIGALGGWNIAESLRLNWNPDDYWSGFIEVKMQRSQRLQFKYAIAAYDRAECDCVEWEEGQFNRHLKIGGDEENIIIENYWGANRICLNILVPKSVIKQNDTEIYLAGGCNQLGNWKNRLKMVRIPIQNLNQMQIAKVKENIIPQNYQAYSIQLCVERKLRCFSYYFIKKTGNQWLPDRVPQRQFIMDSAQNCHSTCLHIADKCGDYQLLELSKFTELFCSKITQRIYIGGCIQTRDDVKQLRKKGVTAIMHLSTSENIGRSGPQNLVKMISEQNKIQYCSLKIEISMRRAGLQQAKQALQYLAQMIQVEDKVVYICCNTGTLLAPLLVSLYLHVCNNFPLRRALQYVKQKHPISSIDQQIMALASQFGELNYLNRQNLDANRTRINRNKLKIEQE